MVEEHTNQPLSRGKSRRERVEHARSRAILDVANELHMELVRSGRDYRWKEHDSMVISPDKNMWNWFSHHQGGDVIALVQTMKEINFNQAIDYLNDGTFKEFATAERVQESFNYYLEPYEQPFEAARNYLKDKRGLSDETVDFFLEKGLLAQANAKVNGSIEPVVVFKSFNFSGEMVGATLQGIEENWEKWPERGYAKNIVRNSDGITGLHVDIGQPNRLIFAESAIDLMSYYELHKDNLQDVRLVSMDGLKEGVIGRHLAQLQSDISGRPLRWGYDQLAEGLQTAIDNNFFADGKHADWITLAVDNDEAGRNFVSSLRDKGAVVIEALPDLQQGKEKMDWNDALKNPLVDNSRLGQARRKLERLNNEFSEATDAVYSHSALANGQPMNDKRGGAAYFKRQEQLEEKVFGKLGEIKKQEERVERLEQQQRFKKEGLNRRGTGLEMSVANIPRIREELEKADRGESFFTKETLKRYRKELERLEGIVEQISTVTISPVAQEIIDGGLVTQWEKQPNTYFVKGLRRVALELTDTGNFQVSSKYRPKTPEEKTRVEELLATKATVTQPLEPSIQVLFEFSESRILAQKYTEGEVIPYQEFVKDLYGENTFASFDLGYYKTYFSLQNEKGEKLTDNFRYDCGTEKELLSEQLSDILPTDYLKLAYEADLIASGKEEEVPNHLSTITRKELSKNIQENETIQTLLSHKTEKTPEIIQETSIEKELQDTSRMITYDTVKKENEELTKRLEDRIKAGSLSISFDTDVYLYDVFGNLGNSHPLKYINAKRLEVLAPLQPILASIDDKTVDLYKNKGTEEQDSLYQALKPHQRTLGVDISTRFIGELAIAAYSTNKQLESLSAEQFGSYYGTRTFDNLSQSIERMLEYPLNEAGIKDYTYGFVTTPNAFYHYLMEQEGEVVLSRSDVEMLMDRIGSQSYQIVEPIQEEVVVPKEKSLEINQETSTGGELLNRNSSFLGEDSPGTAPQPVEQVAQPDFPTNVHLHFTTDDGNMSNKAFRKNMRTLNLYANAMRDSAQWYLSEVADTTMNYVYKTPQEEGLQVLSVHFGKKNWMHLTGVTPVYENWVDSLSEQFIDDIANSKGHFKNLNFALGTPDKLKVLNLLPEIIESDAFVFNDLSSVQKFNKLDLSQALNPEDSDLLLLFKEEAFHQVPASLMRVKGDLKEKLSNIDSGTVLGVYRERDGQIEQVSINEEYVNDFGGQEMLSILQNKQYEESDVDFESTQIDILSAEHFTQVLDAAYNVGDPRKLGAQIPEESKEVWERYYELSDAHEGNFTAVVNAADQLGLVDKNSNFYQEWNQDRIYNEDYHVRLQWAERRPNGPHVPFQDGDLIDYKTFVEAMYKENQAYYQKHQDSKRIADPVTNEGYLPYTKTKFDVYAPGGMLIAGNVTYDLADETEPISRLFGLSCHRLEDQAELAVIDEVILSQLENQKVNQEIATEANEQSLKTQESLQDEPSIFRESFHSSNQEMKAGLAKKIEEIMAEDASKILASSVSQIQESLSVEGDLVGTPQFDGQMLYTNREEFGQDYQLELTVYSSSEIEHLSDTQAPWTLSLIKGEEKLGYLAYGADWGNDFQIEEELKKLADQIGSTKTLEELYKQAEVDAFLASNQGKASSKKDQSPTISVEPFDYKNASAYEISEHAFQKIREYTQSPEDLQEYMDFMSKFPQLSPRNVALIYDQWRGANAVATYDQWQAMGEVLGIKPEDVVQTKATYTNKRTGETKEVIHQGLSVKTGEKSQITLFRPLMVRMIPVLDENGHQVKNDKGNPKYKKLSEATPQEKALVKDGKLPVRQFQERDPKTGYPRFTTYKVFELSQTTLKPESYPKAMPNRHYNFNVDNVKTKEVLEGLCDYAESIGITMMKDEAHVLGNAKGAFYPGEQLILINPDNTPGEKIATTIHELAHATLHNPKLADQYQELPKGQKELEAEMTSHLLSKHFGLDTSEKAIDYMASWTDNLKTLNDKQLTDSLKRVHQTVSKMHKQIENHTKSYSLGKNRGQAPNFPKAPTKGHSR